jgi:hypothetical protein
VTQLTDPQPPFDVVQVPLGKRAIIYPTDKPDCWVVELLPVQQRRGSWLIYPDKKEEREHGE